MRVTADGGGWVLVEFTPAEDAKVSSQDGNDKVSLELGPEAAGELLRQLLLRLKYDETDRKWTKYHSKQRKKRR